jgi:hypothetical protein
MKTDLSILHKNIYFKTVEVEGTLSTHREIEKCVSTLGLPGELCRFSDQATG